MRRFLIVLFTALILVGISIFLFYKFNLPNLSVVKSPDVTSSQVFDGGDVNRISDLMVFKSAINLYLSDAENPFLCVKGKIYSSNQGSTKTDGTGWLPINFNAISSGSPLGKLMVDPVNSGEYVYTYACDPSKLTFELNARLRSPKYSYGGTDDKVSTDGGDNPSVYEVGTQLNLLH